MPRPAPSRPAQTTIPDAIEVFARGFASVRSGTFPFHADQVEGIWRLRDADRKNPRDYRREEWVPFGRDAKGVDRIARRHTRGRYVICAIRSLDEPMESVRDAYKAIGYRLQATEPFFVHSLQRIPRVVSPAKVLRVRSMPLALQLAKASESRPMSPELLSDDAPQRQYVAMVDDVIVGWVKSITVGRRNWCSNMFVQPDHRRAGIGRALMTKMLRDDRAAGSIASVLLSSHVGAKLYPRVGYEQIGELLMLTPKKT